jgi:hypothetical protein
LRADDINAICDIYGTKDPTAVCDFAPVNGFSAECAFDPGSGGWCAARPPLLPAHSGQLFVFAGVLTAIIALRRAGRRAASRALRFD